MPVADLQQLLTAGEECKNLFSSVQDKGGRYSESIQTLVSKISVLCKVLDDHHDAVGSRTSSYANYDSCLLTLEQCSSFIKKYLNSIDKSRTNPGSWLGSSAKSSLEKERLKLESKIVWELQSRDSAALTDLLRHNSVAEASSVRDPLDEAIDTTPYLASSASRAESRRSSGPPVQADLDTSKASSSTSPILQGYSSSSTGPVLRGYFSSSNSPVLRGYGSGSSPTSPVIQGYEYDPRRGSSASTSSGLSYRYPSAISVSTYPQSYRTAEEYAPEENSFQSQASVAPSIISTNVHRICRIMIPTVFEKGTSLDRMPKIIQYEKGWEIVFMAKNGNPILKHSIDAYYSRTCVPYTEWRGWKPAPPYAVWIHDIDFSGKKNRKIRQNLFMATKSSPDPIRKDGTPKYIFADPEQKGLDFMEADHLKRLIFEFHTVIYGKALRDIFDIDNISSARESRVGFESSRQQLKAWSDDTDSYITFFANNEPDRRHLQFPISWFDENFAADEKVVTLDFLTGSRIKSRNKETKLKKAATFETENTRTSSIFSRGSTTSLESRTTVSTMSTSRSNTYDPGSTKKSVEISQKAEQMDHLKVTFTTLADSIRFQALIRSLQSSYQDHSNPTSRPQLDAFSFPLKSPQLSSLKECDSLQSTPSRKSSGFLERI